MKYIGLLVAVVGLVSTVPSLHAVASLRISLNGGASWFTRVDGNDDGIVSLANGQAFGPVGNRWTFTGLVGSTMNSAGTSSDPLANGMATDPMMNLSVGSVRSDGAGVLLIEFSQTFYGPIQAGNTFTTTVQSDNVGDGSTTIWTYLSQRNSGNNLFDKNALLGGISLTGQDASDTASSGPLALGENTLFSLTTRIMIYHSEAGTSSFGARLIDPPSVPEGGYTVVLLGSALLALASLTACVKRGCKTQP